MNNKKNVDDRQLNILLTVLIIITMLLMVLCGILEQIGIVNLGLVESGSLILTFMSVVIAFIVIVYLKEKKAIKKISFYFEIMLIVSLLFSFLTASDKNLAVSGHLLHAEGLFVCLSYVILFSAARLIQKCNYRLIYIGINIIAIIQVIWGTIQAVIQPVFLKDFLSNLYYPNYRASGTMENPNCYASFIIIALGIETIMYWGEDEKKKQRLHFLLLIIYSFALFLSGTRGAIVGYGFAAIVCTYFIIKYSKRNKGKTVYRILGVVAAICIGAGLVVLFSRDTMSDISDRLQAETTVQSVHGLGENRILIWLEAIKQGMTKPVFGLGISQLTMDIEMDGYILTAYDAHNRYIQIFTTQGLFGLMVYLSLNIYIIAKVKKRICNKERFDDNIHCVALFMAYIAYMVADLFCIGTYALAPYIYIIMGMLLVDEYCENKRGEYESK